MRTSGVQPPGSEPIIRAEIVVPEDRMKEIHFQVPVDGYSLMNSEKCIPLHPGQSYLVQNKDSSLRLSSTKVANMLVSSEPLCIRGPRSQQVDKNSEIVFEGVPYSRDRSTPQVTDMSFPGTIEFHPHISYLSITNSLRLEFFTLCATFSEASQSCSSATLEALSIAIRSRALTEHTAALKTSGSIECNGVDSIRYYGSTFVGPGAVDTIRKTAGTFILDPQNRIYPVTYSCSCGGAFEHPALGEDGLACTFDAPRAAEIVLPKSMQSEAAARDWMEASALRGAGVYCSPERVRESSLAEYIPTPGELDACFRWREFVATKEIEHNMRKKFHVHDLKSIIEVLVTRRNDSGRVTELVVNYNSSAQIPRSFTASSPGAIRSVLHQHALKSTSFVLVPTGPKGETPTAYRLEGAGDGRGNGLCKIGSIGMGLLGKSANEILQHYFTDCSETVAYTVD